jgi:histidinol-phosphate aminotransferase
LSFNAMPYQPPDASQGLRLHFNEHTGGCSPAVLEALRSITREEAAWYPDYGPITAATAAAFGVDPDWVQLTNGLDEGLHVVAHYARLQIDRAPVEPPVIIVEPAFEMYLASAEAAGLATTHLMPEEDFAFPTQAMMQALTPATRLVYLTDPNNPTGLAIPRGLVEHIAQAAPQATVLVDEAYAEFSGRTFVGDTLDRHRNLVVGRTFAKAHGLAALRIGALVAHPETLAPLRRLLPPFGVNVCAMRALAAALEDTGYLRASVAAAAESKRLLYDYCERRGWTYWPSEANFVLIRVGDTAPALARALADRGVLVRDKSAAPGCAGCLRITAGVVAHTRICIDALEAIRAAGAN